MFSWTSTNRRRAGGEYPGNRATASEQQQHQNNQHVVAPAIQGTIRPPDITRAQHLNSYLKDDALQKSTRRVSADDTTYDTVFSTVSSDTLILRVHLPPTAHPSAPVSAPAMTLAGVRARHGWLDGRTMKITGYAPIADDATWRDARILLGAAVHEIVKHLQLHPPEILEMTDPGLKAIQTKKTATATASTNHTNNSGAAASAQGQFPSQPPSAQQSSASTDAPPDYESVLTVPEMEMPPIPRQFEELEDLSRDELDKLLEGDELEFMAFCNKLPFMQSLQSMATITLEENVVQAEKNLEREGELKELHGEVSELHRKLRASVQAFREAEKKQDAICAPPDRRKVIRDLNSAKKEAFEESERIAEDWLDDEGNGDVGGFVDSFLSKRKVHHARAAKIEILQQTNGNNNGTTNGKTL